MQEQDVLVQGECDDETSKPSRRRPEINSVENFECPPLPGGREGILVGTRRWSTPPNVVGSVVEEGRGDGGSMDGSPSRRRTHVA